MPFTHIGNIGRNAQLSVHQGQGWSDIDIQWIVRTTVYHLLHHQTIDFMPIRHDVIYDVALTAC